MRFNGNAHKIRINLSSNSTMKTLFKTLSFLLIGLLLGIPAFFLLHKDPMAYINGPAGGTIVPLYFVTTFACVMLLAFKKGIMGAAETSRRKKILRERGVQATATITSVRDTGITVNNNPYVEITVQINKEITATFTTTISRVNLPVVGGLIEVIYDPINPSVCLPAGKIRQ